MRPFVEALAEFLRVAPEKQRPPLEKVLTKLKEDGLDEDERKLLGPVIQRIYNIPDPWNHPSPRKQVEFIQLLRDLEITGWLTDFTLMCEGMESPAVFNFMSALAVLGASLRRHVWVDQAFFKVWPAVQVGLIGTTGIAKTTGADYVVMDIALSAKTFNYLPDEGSGEGLKSELAFLTKQDGDATGLMYVGEMATFLNKAEYNTALVNTLLDIFDSRAVKRRKVVSRMEEPLKNLAVSAIFATNQENLAQQIPDSVLYSGLFGRMILVCRWHEPKEIPSPKKPPEELVNDLVARLVGMSFLRGEALRTPAAFKLYDDHLYGRYKRLELEDPRMGAWKDRLRTHVLRLAMLLAISEAPAEGAPPMIDVRHLEQADGLLQWITLGLPEIYDHIGITEYGATRARIISVLENSKGRILDKELRNKMHHIPGRVLEDHLRDLQLSGIVAIDTPGILDDGAKAWRLKRRRR